jgi:gas vesicle protein
MLRLLVFAVIVFAAVAAACYFGLPHFLPALFSSQSQTETAKQLELLKVLSGAVAAAVTGLLTAGNSMLMIRRQLRANKDLETHKGEILKVLEDKKNELAGQLDTQRQKLGHELGLKRKDIEDAFSQITSLRDAVTAYRHAVGALRRGEFEAEEADATAKDLDLAMAFFQSNTALYQALDSFRQRGLYLRERAARIETPNGQRNLWREPSKAAADGGALSGPRFAADGENVFALLSAERERLVKGG